MANLALTAASFLASKKLASKDVKPKEEKVIPIPPDSTAKTKARKKRARKPGSRELTILTEELGG